eukprot:SAG22_NODE_8301_length_666_cov_0.966490_2_plen_104_part_01
MQGRIELYNENIQGWGTVCGHWLWDNDNPADIVCRQLGYEGGVLYTYGASSHHTAAGTCGGSTTLPSAFGYRRCSGSEATLWDCTASGDPADRDCASGGCTGDR